MMKRNVTLLCFRMVLMLLMSASGLTGCSIVKENAEVLKEGLQYLSAEAEKDAH